MRHAWEINRSNAPSRRGGRRALDVTRSCGPRSRGRDRRSTLCRRPSDASTARQSIGLPRRLRLWRQRRQHRLQRRASRADSRWAAPAELPALRRSPGPVPTARPAPAGSAPSTDRLSAHNAAAGQQSLGVSATLRDRQTVVQIGLLGRTLPVRSGDIASQVLNPTRGPADAGLRRRKRHSFAEQGPLRADGIGAHPEMLMVSIDLSDVSFK